MIEIFTECKLSNAGKEKISTRKRKLLKRGKIDTFAFVNVFIVAVNIKQIEKISKALGDSNRLKILHYISNKGGSGQCAEIQQLLDLAQPSISHHVKILIEAGLIEPEKEGRNHKYTLNEEVLEEYMNFLEKLKA
jgi:ArsR family transcriptional regulator